MKQLLVLSGKGGTGKTTVASFFIDVANAACFADCDVDAPNLHLVFQKFSKVSHKDFCGMPVAFIQPQVCTCCGLCAGHCRFGAIAGSGGNYAINPFACEGCGVCEAVCPAHAVQMLPDVAGELMLYKQKEERTFSTARLRMGKGNSGLLVTDVKKQMLAHAPEKTQLAVIDGSPGIGCPVIASISGVDMVLLVAEPSASGLSDMERIVATAKGFEVAIAVCVNKYDTSPENTKKIEDFCQEENLAFVGKIPYDTHVVEAVNAGKSIAGVDCAASAAMRQVYNQTLRLLHGGATHKE